MKVISSIDDALAAVGEELGFSGWLLVDQDRIDRVRGFDITVVTDAKTDDEGRALLRHLGFPFRSEDAQV